MYCEEHDCEARKCDHTGQCGPNHNKKGCILPYCCSSAGECVSTCGATSLPEYSCNCIWEKTASPTTLITSDMESSFRGSACVPEDTSNPHMHIPVSYPVHVHDPHSHTPRHWHDPHSHTPLPEGYLNCNEHCTKFNPGNCNVRCEMCHHYGCSECAGVCKRSSGSDTLCSSYFPQCLSVAGGTTEQKTACAYHNNGNEVCCLSQPEQDHDFERGVIPGRATHRTCMRRRSV